MVGTTYRLPDGTLGRVVTRWFGDGCPRNILMEREDGTLVVRPFRGVRRASATSDRIAVASKDVPSISEVVASGSQDETA